MLQKFEIQKSFKLYQAIIYRNGLEKYPQQINFVYGTLIDDILDNIAMPIQL